MMGIVQKSLLGIGGGLLGAMVMMPMQPPAAIAQSCVANTSCTNRPVRVTPGEWISFEIINRTGSIISIEQPSSVEAIALSPGQRVTLSGSTKQNASFLFWDVQGLSVEARVREISTNNLQVELLWGDGFGNSSLYLKDDGRIELL
ncbi:hypothetical protein Lepto7376_1642 [[Leptolyngbya] sp. PCC 7376]|uniref:hypothetical protein n=1 Tax=[Leptolyngbya] sp. PCC 7376 TaxID=111781 RepID=UPI00029F10E6|nr:hypothetical protein [[Leptolyngbya] sp. PCC 7376]AFY37976.1 hypothetical protein Lepto7376_1642 [[Leptolyngbya] sp. PCC 7376]